MDWRDEKKALLETIRRKEQEAQALSKRFHLLQETLKEQQKLLDRYQRALATAGEREKQNDKTHSKTPKTSVKRSRDVLQPIDALSVNLQTEAKPEQPWMARKTSEFSNTVEKPTVARPTDKAEKEAKKMVNDKTSSNTKRLSGLAPTWAEEKRRIQKKPRWEKLQQEWSNRLEKVPERHEEEKQQNQGFAYVEVVRSREERAALPAHDCVECKKYYDALGGLGSPGTASAQMHKCSRHRARFEPYQTPDDFWRLSFPDSHNLE